MLALTRMTICSCLHGTSVLSWPRGTTQLRAACALDQAAQCLNCRCVAMQKGTACFCVQP